MVQAHTRWRSERRSSTRFLCLVVLIIALLGPYYCLLFWQALHWQGDGLLSFSGWRETERHATWAYYPLDSWFLCNWGEWSQLVRLISLSPPCQSSFSSPRPRIGWRLRWWRGQVSSWNPRAASTLNHRNPQEWRWSFEWTNFFRPSFFLLCFRFGMLISWRIAYWTRSVAARVHHSSQGRRLQSRECIDNRCFLTVLVHFKL